MNRGVLEWDTGQQGDEEALHWGSAESGASPGLLVLAMTLPFSVRKDMDLPRVLVIDDEELLGQTIQLGLEDGFDVQIETSGQAGLTRLLAEQEIRLVLCDLSLPDLSGVEIYQKLSAARPDLLARFVVMTGGAVSTESRDFLDSYRGPVLNKPFTLNQLEELAATLVD